MTENSKNGRSNRPPGKGKRARRRPRPKGEQPAKSGASAGGAETAPAKSASRRRRRRGDVGKPKEGAKPDAPSPALVVDEEEADKAIPVEECAFAEYNLEAELISGLAASGYRTPTPIQARTLPHALEERDVVGQARTGTGKTAAFLVPALHMLSDKPGPRVLVVVPTRELAVQVAKEAQRLGREMKVRALAIYGGDPMRRQLAELERNPKVIAATPGRLMDHLRRKTLKLVDLDMLILDEADRMFDLGFRDDIAKIMRWAPTRRQTMLFSATLSDEVLDLAARYMKDPEHVLLAPDKMTVDEVNQSVFPVDAQLKTNLLLEILAREKPERSIIFTRTKIGADRLAGRLQKKGQAAQELHSGLPQKKRERILRDFRAGTFPYLIATDVAARGIDIDGISHVINYDIPENAEDYVHRIGRTARMGKSGRACTFVTRDDGQFLTAIEKLINKAIPEERIDGFRYRVAVEEPKEEAPPPKPQPRSLFGYPRRRPR